MKRLLFVVALLVATGCVPARTSHDVARAGVISLSAAARLTHQVCAGIIFDAVDHQDQLSADDIRKVMHLGDVCETSLKVARPLLETAAAGVDHWKESGAGALACTVARATDALSGAAAELRSFGAKVPWELDQALAVGAFVGAACKP